MLALPQMPEPESDIRLGEARQGIVLVSTRSVAILIVLFAAAALGCRFLDDEHARAAALKVVLPTLAVGIVPGALAAMLWSPRPQLTVLEVLGFGAAFSFGVVHLLTILAITAHLSTTVVLVMLAIASTCAAGLVVRRSPGAIVLSVDEGIVLTLLIGLGTLLFRLGSPSDPVEDQVHVAIVRRLSSLVSPSIDNIYFAPDIVYTYPFPGTHYYMALIARLGDVDALFLYQKLRFFWGPAALVMLHLAARAVFGTRAVACGVTSTAVVLVCTGVFAMVPELNWSQLVPYSHAADVAMTVLLPAMLVTAFGYLQAVSRREQAFFFTSVSLLAVMLTSVHIREVVQFCVYVGSFLVVSLFITGLRPYARRAMVLLGSVVMVAIAYTAWHTRVAQFVTGIVDEQRAELLSRFVSSSLPELLLGPAYVLLGDFMPYSHLVWHGLTPFFLFAGPSVILLFRHRPLVWLLASSTLAYLAVMSVPLVAFPYVYFTYFEILFTPVRNIIFFVYLFAGAFLYGMGLGVARLDRTRLSPLIAGGAVGIFALLATVSISRTGRGFFAPLLVAYGLTFAWVWSRRVTASVSVRRIGMVIVSLLALATLWPDRAPEPRTEVVNVRWTAGLTSARQATLEREFGLTNGERTPGESDGMNVWSYRLHDLSRENVRALVTHPDVVDTHYIDRSSFSVPPHSPAASSPFLGVQRVSWLQYPGWTLLIGMPVFMWLVGFLVPYLLASSRGVKAAGTLAAAFREPFYRHALPFAFCVVPFALWSVQTTLSPLLAGLVSPDTASTPKAMIEQRRCITVPQAPAPLSDALLPEAPIVLPERTACPPDYATTEWVKRHVPVDGVFAINRWNPHLPSVFMPQQVVVSPSLGLLEEHQLFERYYRFYRESMRKYRVQPFFNDVETPIERAAFVEELGVTHVLVDPDYYDQMRSVLDESPEQFALQYSGGQWAVYAVVQSGAPRREGI